MSITSIEEPHVSHVQLLLGGVHEDNRDYVSKRLCEHIDGLISCRFVDDNNQVEISFDTNELDQYKLLSAIQRLGHPVQLVDSETVQAQLRIEGMHCNSCVSNICGAILDLPGAIDIQLTFLDKLATIIYDPRILQLDDIITEIEKLGFQVAISNAPQFTTTVKDDSCTCSNLEFLNELSFFYSTR
jgi:copper chaperone CopZ